MDRKNEEQLIRLTKLMFIVVMVLIILTFVQCEKEAKAGIITGENHLGGFSYLMECAYKRELPQEPYRTMLYDLFMKHRYVYRVTDEEKEILCRIVEAEATDGTIQQKMNVASCVIARVESSEFPNTVKKVVFEKHGNTWQFSPLGDGRYYSVKVTADTKTAVNNVLKFGKCHSCLWFCSNGSYNKKDKNGRYISYHRNNLEYGFFDDMHHYFY